MIVSNINIDNTKNNINIKDVIKKHYQNKTNKILIINNQNNRQIILIGKINIKYNYNDKKIFDNIYLPELIKFYLDNNIITTENINDNEYNINDTLYIINYNEELDNIKKYISELNNINKYKLELSNNCIIEDDIVPDNKRAYSYGYINILLISLLISVITIIFIITKYH